MVMGKNALPEHWTELNAARTEKERCGSEINAIKVSCLRKHGRRKVYNCRECFSKIIDLIQGRYCDETGREWFTTRRAFTHELGALFADAKDGKVDLHLIEQRIESEKEAWYRWVLRTYPEFLAIADSGVDQEELRDMLDDPDKTREQLIEKVWEGVGKPADWSTELDSFIKKVEAVKGNPAELKKLYISQFFKDSTTGETLENAQKYLDEFQATDSMELVEIIDKIVQDERSSKNSQPQRDQHKGRLDELRRAKTAFEQSKLQAKARRQEAQARAADELYDLPPCVVCSNPVDPRNVFSCTTCQALVHLGSDQKLTVYCSEYCLHRGYVSFKIPFPIDRFLTSIG